MFYVVLLLLRNRKKAGFFGSRFDDLLLIHMCTCPHSSLCGRDIDFTSIQTEVHLEKLKVTFVSVIYLSPIPSYIALAQFTAHKYTLYVCVCYVFISQ